MSKRKRAKFPGWQDTGKKISNYARVPDTQLFHPSMLGLSGTAFTLYVYMLQESRGKPTFIFPKETYLKICSSSAWYRARDELIAKGFITMRTWHKGSKIPNEYTFSSMWMEH